MDFIDWCHRVLHTLEDERLNAQLSEHRLREVLFGNAINDNTRIALHDALVALHGAGLAEQGKYTWKITPRGRAVLLDPTKYWTAICQQDIDPEEAAILRFVNAESPKQGTNPDRMWLQDVGRDAILTAFNVEPPPMKSNDHQAQLSKFIYDLPQLLADRRFLKLDRRMGYQNYLKPTYQGLVWETRRDFTIESNFIDGLLAEWETTNVDFKREFGLNTQKQKGEFAKDALGLATTKSSGRRYMVIGFDDKTGRYYGPPDPSVTQNRMEQVLSTLTDPLVTIRYNVVNYKGGQVGKIEVIRQPEKLPYCATQDVFDDRGKRVLEKGKVYVRHGSQTEPPTAAELDALEEEGRAARGESQP